MGILEPTLTPFKGKVITVAGASRGTGLATVKYLVLRGATVSMSSSSHKGIDKARAEVLEECPGSDDRIMTMACDITKYEDVQAWIAETMKRFGRIDACANVSGKEQRKLFPLTDLPIEDYKKIMDVNVNGLFYLLREQMKVISEGGSIVNVGSVCSSFSSPYYGAYIASKHGAAGLTKAAAFEGATRDELRARDSPAHSAYFSMGLNNHKPYKTSLNNKWTANLVYEKLSVRIFGMAEHYVGSAIYAEALNGTEVDHDTCASFQLDENYVACPVDHSEELIRILQSHEN
ncbi:hypothetical protein K4K57_001231 [Colletotrichum sp. SAR 10_99]|nr:hypothetical protein K4K57_001231 [Colletotrichum sp. SAR 10_99]